VADIFRLPSSNESFLVPHPIESYSTDICLASVVNE